MSDRFARVLRTRDVLALSFGAMIGWSWVLMTGYWVNTAGSIGTTIAFTAGGLSIALIGLTYAELASALPKTGGEHVYTHRGLGPTPSFVCTWALLMAYVAVCVFESVALPTAVELTITECEPGVKGNSATSRTKPATLETGLTVRIPEYIKQGEKIKVDTRTGEFLSRV